MSLLVAEIGQSHDGSLGTAHAFIDAAAKYGADGVKFQTHIASAESHPSEPWRVNFSYQDESRYEYWRRMEFTRAQWSELYEHTKSLGLIFASSPFSTEAVDLLVETGIDVWKIASGEVSNLPLLKALTNYARPVWLSSGMSGWTDLEIALDALGDLQSSTTILQCTSRYPCPAGHVGLNILREMQERFGLPVGLSDHSGTIYSGLAAVTLGAKVVEVHVTFSRDAFGPDVESSVTFEELRTLADGIAFIRKALQNPVDKEESATALIDMRTLFGRSLYLTRRVMKGHRIKKEDLAILKPGGGLGPEMYTTVLGATATHEMMPGHRLETADLALANE